MPRGLIIFLSVCALVAVFGFWGLPWLTHAIFGESRNTKVVITMAVDDYEVSLAGTSRTVPRTVVGLTIDFPMGGAPENTGELQVKDDEGRVLKEVYWGAPESKEDIPDKGITRWVFREVYFPILFRQGALWNQNRELTYIKLPPVPFNPP